MSKYMSPISFVKPLFTLALITSMVISPLLFVGGRRVSAASPNAAKDAPATGAAPVSAPTEPFILPQHTLAETVFPAVGAYLDKVGSFLSGPKVPEGFEVI